LVIAKYKALSEHYWY